MLSSGVYKISVTIAYEIPEKMKSHIFSVVSMQNSLLIMQRSHLVKCSSGATSFSLRCLFRLGSRLLRCSS